MTIQLPRLMLAAEKSGGGKTTLTCALLQALVNRRLTPAACKCGPDYIDPLFHSEIIGAKAANLDLFFTAEETVRQLLGQAAQGCNLAVLEGVMGYYDGVGGRSTTASSYHLATATGTPVVLVLDVQGASLSLCATLQGFLHFRPNSGIVGVILNRCSAGLHAMLAPLLEEECGVAVLGYLPRLEDCTLHSRHLGLVTAGEVADLRQKLDTLADALEKSVDVDRLLALAEAAPPLSFAPQTIAPVTATAPRIAVAKDRAFCFYYRESLQLLEQLGATLVFFSPLAAAELPPDIHALYLGGGYPELYASALAENMPMRNAVRRAVEGNLPTLAECGGFMYLHRSITAEGVSYPMAGVVDADCHNTGRLTRFGYATLTAQQDNLLCRAGESIAAHEFHYYDSDDNGEAFTAQRPLGGTSWACAHGSKSLVAGFPHLYLQGNPSFAAAFVAAAAEYQRTHTTPKEDFPCV